MMLSFMLQNISIKRNVIVQLRPGCEFDYTKTIVLIHTIRPSTSLIWHFWLSDLIDVASMVWGCFILLSIFSGLTTTFFAFACHACLLTLSVLRATFRACDHLRQFRRIGGISNPGCEIHRMTSGYRYVLVFGYKCRVPPTDLLENLFTLPLYGFSFSPPPERSALFNWVSV